METGARASQITQSLGGLVPSAAHGPQTSVWLEQSQHRAAGKDAEAELEEDMLTYITSQDILKLGNWISYRPRSRTGWQAKIRVLEEKGTQGLSPTLLTCHWAHR